MGKHFHISQSIDGALSYPTHRFIETFDGIFSDDNGRPLSAAKAKELLLEEKALGHKLIRSAGCDNFDPENGCLGHEKPEESDSQKPWFRYIEGDSSTYPQQEGLYEIVTSSSKTIPDNKSEFYNFIHGWATDEKVTFYHLISAPSDGG